MQMVKPSTFRALCVVDAGLMEYEEAWEFQKSIFHQRLDNKVPDTLILLEHSHTYTLGKVAKKEHLLFSEFELKEKGISVFDIDRGGDITYHGPGQLVAYPIINLNDWVPDSHKYLRALEDVLISVCAEFGIESGRNPLNTGVWVGNNKIAAIGIKISKWVTMHGIALNVNTDLTMFNGIVPCGVKEGGVTSLSLQAGKSIAMNTVKKSFVKNFADIFHYSNIDYSEYELVSGSLKQ